MIAIAPALDAPRDVKLRFTAYRSWVQRVPCPVKHCKAQPWKPCTEPSHGGFRVMRAWHPARQVDAEKQLAGTVRDETGAVA